MLSDDSSYMNGHSPCFGWWNGPLDKSSIKVYALKFNKLYIFILFQNLEREGFYILKMT